MLFYCIDILVISFIAKFKQRQDQKVMIISLILIETQFIIKGILLPFLSTLCSMSVQFLVER